MNDPWSMGTYREISAELAGLPRPPLDDEEAERFYKDIFPWAFDKYRQLNIFGSTEHGIGQPPERGRYIVKPRFNPHGLALGVKRGGNVTAGELWQKEYKGEHWSVDVPVLNGIVRYPILVSTGIEDSFRIGRYLAWEIHGGYDHDESWWIFESVRPFLQEMAYQGSYRGIINLELRHEYGTRVSRLNLIEMHLRPSVEFFPIYGEACVRSIFEFYAGKRDDILPCEKGTVIVEPHGTEALNLKDDCEEQSWRRRLHYLRDN